MKNYLKCILWSLWIGLLLLGTKTVTASNKWVGTWGCAPYAAGDHTPPSPYLENNTLRQIVRVSIGGDTLRIKFSNITSSKPVTMNAVTVSVSTQVGGSSIDASTTKQLTFGGETSVTMQPYTQIVSDPIAFPLIPGTHLAISTHYGACEIASDMTFHYGSRTDSYILKGDQTTNESFSGATRIERWYHIASIDVKAPEKAGAVVVFGNSITDGYGLKGGLKNTWPDIFSGKLLKNDSTAHVSVLNMGIGGTQVSTSGVGRFYQDVLSQSGLRWILIFYGVNDIGANKSASQIIEAYENLVIQAHSENIRVYGATITPFGGSGYYSDTHEAVRSDVNAWIKKTGKVDHFIDLDKAIRDETDTTRMLEKYSNDWLHPNAAGYKLLGESIDVNLFIGGDTIFPQPNMSHIETYCFEAECTEVGENWIIQKDAGASNGTYVTVKSGVQSLNSASTISEDIIEFNFNISNDSTYYIYARINCPTADDDSYWMKLDDENFNMHNGLITSGWQWVPLSSHYLSQGEHSVSITYREDGAKLDKLCISNYSLTPVGMGYDATNICEVEETKDEEDSNAIKRLNLSGFKCFPNPFKDSTIFELQLDKTNNVHISIFNLSGKKVSTVLNEELNTGVHKVEWDATGFNGNKLKNGFYLYQTQIGEEVIKGKLEIIE